MFDLREHVYWAFASLFSMGGTRKFLPPEDGFGTRVTWIGLAWLVTLSSAMYMGETITLISAYKKLPQVTSIEDVVDGKLSACIHRTTVSTVLSYYRTVNVALDPLDGFQGFYKRGDVYSALEEGKCDVILALKQDLEVEHSHGRHCNLVATSKPLFYENHGFPIGSSHARELTIAFQEAISDGMFAKSLKRWKPRNECTAHQQQQLQLFQLSGAFLSSGVLALIGVMVTCFKLYKENRRKISF